MEKETALEKVSLVKSRRTEDCKQMLVGVPCIYAVSSSTDY